jgi:RNase P subunit RPR2
LKCGAGEGWRRSVGPVTKNEVLHRIKGKRNILQKIKRRKANWIGHVLCRNCHPIHVVGGKINVRIEVRGRQGRRHKQLMDDHKEMRG